MQTTLITLGIIVILIIGLRYLVMSKIKNIPLVADHEKIITLTEKNFQQQTKGKIILVDFWASWCAPCRMMAPVLNDVSASLKGNSYIGKVDVQQHQELANKFKVRGIPTLILFKDGKEVDRFVGVKTKDFLLQEIGKVK